MYFSFLAIPAAAESLRALVEGNLELSADNPEGSSVSINYNGSAVISLARGTRFLRGIELELSAPQAWLAHRGSLAMAIYADFNRPPVSGVNDLEGRRIAFEPLPNKIKTVYQIPIRKSHGLRSTPYVSVPADTTLPSSFPIMFKLTPIIKGLSEEIEHMRFTLSARPILGDEGAVKFSFRFPDQLKDKPFTMLIDDTVIDNISEERLLKEGEHHIVILSDNYRNENRRFMVERAKRLEITIDLQDPTPILLFEAPEHAKILLNNSPIAWENGPISAEPGVYEVKFQVGDYTLTKTITIQRGKSYRVALSVDIDVDED